MRDTVPGNMEEKENRSKNTNNVDSGDARVERKGKQGVAGLLWHMDEGSLHRGQQTKWRKQRASLTACPCHQTPSVSASCILQRTHFDSFLLSTLFPVHPLCCFGL